uniref:Major sperm protein n=1 Tax=Rhabditophanes sp. KR3021 TaxID=114890 RepID=A0AC35UG71_9BILA
MNVPTTPEITITQVKYPEKTVLYPLGHKKAPEKMYSVLKIVFAVPMIKHTIEPIKFKVDPIIIMLRNPTFSGRGIVIKVIGMLRTINKIDIKKEASFCLKYLFAAPGTGEKHIHEKWKTMLANTSTINIFHF